MCTFELSIRVIGPVVRPEKNKSKLFTKMATNINFKNDSEFHASIQDLKDLGWEFNFESDENDSKYHIIIRYYSKTDKFTMQLINSQKLANKISEGGDEENAGDSDMIKEDLINLNEQGKLFNINLDVEWL